MKDNLNRIYAYYVVNGSLGYEKVEGLGLIGDKIYYYPSDSMLMTYDSPISKIVINDQVLYEVLVSLKPR